MAVDFGADADIAAIKALSGTNTTWAAKVTSLWRNMVHSNNNGFGPNAILGAVNAGVGYPVGAIVDFHSSTVPSGFAVCDGRSLSRTTYATLFGVIGTRFGSDSGGTFKVPDFRRRQSVGRSSGSDVGSKSGSETTVMAAENLPEHSHAVGSVSVASAPTHGHQDAGVFGDGSNIYSVAEEAAFLIMPSPELINANTPNSVSVNKLGREYLSQDVHTQSAGAHTHGTGAGNTETAGSSENISVVSPSITMVKCIHHGVA